MFQHFKVEIIRFFRDKNPPISNSNRSTFWQFTSLPCCPNRSTEFAMRPATARGGPRGQSPQRDPDARALCGAAWELIPFSQRSVLTGMNQFLVVFHNKKTVEHHFLRMFFNFMLFFQN